MPIETPPSVDALPTVPQPGSATFRADSYIWTTALPTWGTQMQALALNVKNNALEAQGSATTAATKAGEALIHANTASGHVATALGHANTADIHRLAAAGSATTAAQRLGDVEALLDQFEDKYLGAKTSDPTADNDGNPLQAGAIYVNSASGFLRAFNGTAWVQGISALAGVESLNGLQGALLLKTINGQPLTGAGDVSAQTPHFLLMAQGVI